MPAFPRVVLAAIFLVRLGSAFRRSPKEVGSNATASSLLSKDAGLAAEGKHITYIWHGAYETRLLPPRGLEDARLTTKGEQQVAELVKNLHRDDWRLLERIKQAKLVVVSPFRRALGTALLLLALTRCDNEPLPKIRVASRMMQVAGERYAENPVAGAVLGVQEDGRLGYNADPQINDPNHPQLTYLFTLVDKVLATDSGPLSGVCNKARTEDISEVIVGAFKKERLEAYHRTPGVRQGGIDWGNPAPPADAWHLAFNIRDLKRTLAAEPETEILMVGHQQWGRYAFTHLLPPPKVGKDTPQIAWAAEEAVPAQIESLRTFSHRAAHLKDAGVFCARLDKGGMLVRDTGCHHYGVDPLAPTGPEDTTMFADARDAAAARALPSDAKAWQWIGEKKIDMRKKFRILTLSYSAKNSAAFYSWSDRWGRHKEYMPLSDTDVEPNFWERSVVITGPMKGQKMHKTSPYTFRTRAYFTTFVRTFEVLKHMIRARDGPPQISDRVLRQRGEVGQRMLLLRHGGVREQGIIMDIVAGGIAVVQLDQKNFEQVEFEPWDMVPELCQRRDSVVTFLDWLPKENQDLFDMLVRGQKKNPELTGKAKEKSDKYLKAMLRVALDEWDQECGEKIEVKFSV